MKLEFNICKLKEDSRLYKKACLETGEPNEFIIVGEEKVGHGMDCYKVQQVGEEGIRLIGGLKIDEAALLVEKKDLTINSDKPGVESIELEVPKEYLTVEIIENIQRLNDY